MTPIALALCGLVFTAEQNPWETQRTAPILVKTRARAGTEVREIWAEGEMAASPIDIQETLLDVKRYPQFMPYVTDSRFLGEAEPDGSRFTYCKIDLPVSRKISSVAAYAAMRLTRFNRPPRAAVGQPHAIGVDNVGVTTGGHG